MTNDSGLNVEPDKWSAVDANDAFHYDNDSGSYFGPEAIETYTEPYQSPGEIWHYKIRLTLSSEPTDNIIMLEVLDDGGNYIARSVIPDYGGFETVLQTVVPTYVANDDYDGPADSSGGPTIRLQVVGDDSGNYFVDTYAVRVREPLEDGDKELSPSGDNLDSGLL